MKIKKKIKKEKEILGVNFEAFGISVPCGNTLYLYFNNPGKSVPLGIITADVTKYNFGGDRNYWDSPIYNIFSCYSFLVHVHM